MGYLGSKAGAGVFQAIIGLMPPHETYVEPFAGSGAVYSRKPAARLSMLREASYGAAMELARSVARSDDTQVIYGDALSWLTEWRPGPEHGRVLIYCDPPYVHSTRSSRHRYDHEMTDDDHRCLARALRVLAAEYGCAVMVSGYPSPLYDELYAGWETREFQAMTRGGVRTEKLWLSFTPSAAHWCSYAGDNFTKRQQIKRKAERWAAKFEALPSAERQAIMAAIMAVEDR